MSILDAFCEFSDAQAVTSSAISNVFDSGSDNTLKNLGVGEPMWLVVLTQTTATDTSSDATLTVSLESDSTANLATSATVHYTTAALAFAAYATAGTVLVCIPLPSGQYERYAGVRYTVASGPLTAGKFDAFLTRDPSLWQAYANAAVV
jgi:hypothetical protein